MQTRSQQTLHIRELLPQALGAFTVLPAVDSPLSMPVHQQDEAGGPVRPAVRVPLSASHYMPLHRSLSPADPSYGSKNDERAWAAAG